MTSRKYIRIRGRLYRLVDEWSRDAKAFFAYLKSVKQTLDSLFRGVLVDIKNMDRVFKGLQIPSIIKKWNEVKGEFALLSTQEKLILRESTQLLRKQAEVSREERRRSLHNDSDSSIKEFHESLSLLHKCIASIDKMKTLTSFKHQSWKTYYDTRSASFYQETQEFEKGMEALNERFRKLHHLLYELEDTICREMRLLNIRLEGRTVSKPNPRNYQTRGGLWKSRGPGYKEYSERLKAFENQSKW